MAIGIKRKAPETQIFWYFPALIQRNQLLKQRFLGLGLQELGCELGDGQFLVGRHNQDFDGAVIGADNTDI
jgi:hypothetical protein